LTSIRSEDPWKRARPKQLTFSTLAEDALAWSALITDPTPPAHPFLSLHLSNSREEILSIHRRSGEAGFYPTRNSLSTLHFHPKAKPADRAVPPLPNHRSVAARGGFYSPHPTLSTRFFRLAAEPVDRAGPPLRTTKVPRSGRRVLAAPTVPVNRFSTSRRTPLTGPSHRSRPPKVPRSGRRVLGP
jgi:hypothetical protein